MIIKAISDLHGELPDIPKCDILCICGDTVPLTVQRNISESEKWWLTNFCEWVKSLPCKKVFFTAGNHDFFLEKVYRNIVDYNKFISKLKVNSNNKAVVLINKDYKYKGVTFYGFPYIRPIPFQLSLWAFEDDYSDKDNINVYNNLSTDKLKVDILITHDNPNKNKVLRGAVLNKMNKKPVAWFYGHWHEEISTPENNEYNCSLLDNYYNIKRNFDIPTVEINKKDIVYERNDN